jgi:hypothetical protein
VMNRACSRYSAGCRRHGTWPASCTDPATAAFPPQPDQVQRQLHAARPGPPRGPDQGAAELHRRGLLERGQARLRHCQLQPGLAQRPGQPVPFRGQPRIAQDRRVRLIDLGHHAHLGGQASLSGQASPGRRASIGGRIRIRRG